MGNYSGKRSTFDQEWQTAQRKGKTNFRAEERKQQNLGLSNFVNPAGYGVTRLSKLRFMEQDGQGPYTLSVGVSMPVETLIDGTGSLGYSNIALALENLATLFDLLARAGGIFNTRGYDTHLAHAIFGDVDDRGNYLVLNRTLYEMAEKVAEQITLLDPAYGGCGDGSEDPQYGLFAAACLSDMVVNKYEGLKGYHFTLTDEKSRTELDRFQMTKLFGDEVYEKLAANGFPEISASFLPDLSKIINYLLKQRHAFMLLMPEVSYRYGYQGLYNFWSRFYGPERVVKIPSVELLAETQVAIMGLTEGVLDLQTLTTYLTRNAGLSENKAEKILRAVSHIPIGAQMMAPAYDKLPKAGDIFAIKTDLFPTTGLKKLEAKKEDWL